MKNEIKLQLEENLRAAAREYRPEPTPGFEQRLTSALAQARIETAVRALEGDSGKSRSWKWPLVLASSTSLLAIALAWGMVNHSSQMTSPAEIADRSTASGHELKDHSGTAEQSLQQELAGLVGFFEDSVQLPEFDTAEPAAGDGQSRWLLADAKWEELLQNPAVRLACSGENLAAAYVLFKDLKSTENR